MRGFVVGVAGGTASGKSTFADRLRRRGAAYYSVDEAAHALYAPGSAVTRDIRRVFGSGVIAGDGSVDRRGLAAAVVGAPAALRRLEGVVHPRLARAAASAVRRIRSRHRLTVVEAGPLLFALGLHRLADLVVVVRSPLRVRVGRLARDLGVSPKEAARRIRAFAPRERSLVPALRRAKRGITVTGNASPGALRAAVRSVLRLAGVCPEKAGGSMVVSEMRKRT